MRSSCTWRLPVPGRHHAHHDQCPHHIRGRARTIPRRCPPAREPPPGHAGHVGEVPDNADREPEHLRDSPGHRLSPPLPHLLAELSRPDLAGQLDLLTARRTSVEPAERGHVTRVKAGNRRMPIPLPAVLTLPVGPGHLDGNSVIDRRLRRAGRLSIALFPVILAHGHLLRHAVRTGCSTHSLRRLAFRARFFRLQSRSSARRSRSRRLSCPLHVSAVNHPMTTSPPARPARGHHRTVSGTVPATRTASFPPIPTALPACFPARNGPGPTHSAPGHRPYRRSRRSFPCSYDVVSRAGP